MTIFNIKFFYKEIEYTSNVLKIESTNELTVQWHVYNVKPIIDKVPDMYIFVYDSINEKFTYSLFNGTSDLPATILKSIKQYCNENEISFDK
jgi:hypothetical protein